MLLSGDNEDSPGYTLLVSDGYMLTIFQVEAETNFDELAPELLPAETEEVDISINVSHETNPMPTEIDIYPKCLNIDQAIYIIRCMITQRLPSP
jgi:hypothetical protein